MAYHENEMILQRIGSTQEGHHRRANPEVLAKCCQVESCLDRMNNKHHRAVRWPTEAMVGHRLEVL